MQKFTLSGNEFFDCVSYPVLLARGEKIHYFNHPAEELFRLDGTKLKEGEELPKALQIQDQVGVSAQNLAGQEWVITSQSVSAGILYWMRQERDHDEMARAWLHQVAERMRSPMTSMTAAIQVLERNMLEIERLRNQKYLELFHKSYYRMLRLAGNLETLCQMDDGWVEKWFTPCVLDLAGLCRKIVRETDTLAEAAGAKLCYEEKQGSVLIKGEERLLTTLLYHLLTNSLRSLKGETGEVRLKLSQQKGRAIMSVEDSGDGMNDRELIAAFEPEVSEQELKPLGMGLPICRKIATLHKGALMLTSNKRGTRVTLSIPVADGKEQPALRSRAVDFSGGFSQPLVQLSDALPRACFRIDE